MALLTWPSECLIFVVSEPDRQGIHLDTGLLRQKPQRGIDVIALRVGGTGPQPCEAKPIQAT
jgi:hypothetical protein